MILTWPRRAQRDLHELIAYIAEDSLQAASLVATRILRSAELLLQAPRASRPGRVEGTRELIVLRTPYLLVYRLTSRGAHPPRLSRSAYLACTL